MLLREIKILNENVQLPDDVVKFIHENCQPYLNAIGNDLSKVLYRGISKNRLNSLHKIPDMTNCAVVPGHYKARNPKDVPQKYHDFMNTVFTESFGAPFRNGVFTTGDFLFAQSYGTAVSVFPMGEFKFCWSKNIQDISPVIQSFLDDDEDEYDDGLLSEKNFTYSLQHNYQSTDLKAAVDSGHEIMIYCDSCLVYVAS